MDNASQPLPARTGSVTAGLSWTNLKTMRAVAQGYLKDFFTDVESFWVAGLALLQIYLAKRWLRLQGEDYEWAQYLLLGTVFPLLLLGSTLLRASGRIGSLLLRTLKFGLAAFCIYLCAAFALKNFSYLLLAVSLTQGVALIGFAALRFRFRGDQALNAPPSQALTGLLLSVLAWIIAVRLIWWFPFDKVIVASDFALTVFLIALLLVTANLGHRPSSSESQKSGKWFWIWNIIGLCILAKASVRIDYRLGLQDAAVFHHCGVVVGPAEMVREGGWLLWDVPSQYGFLSTLTLAWLPTPSVWQSLYTVNSVLCFLTASFLFLSLRSLRTGITSFWFALAVTLAAVFMIPGNPYVLSGPYVAPSCGPFRFFWPYALLAVLVWEYRMPLTSRSSGKVLWLGCLVWLAGTLWSGESATYCAATWLPAYALLCLRRAYAFHPGTEQGLRRLRMFLTYLLLPGVLLVSTMGIITGYYLLALGHVPEWQAYFEYCLGPAMKLFALPIDPNGAVWVLFGIFVELSTIVVYLLHRDGTFASLSLMTGCWGAFWAMSSYFIGRSHPACLSSISPILCTTLALGLYLLARHQAADRLSSLIRMSLIPLLTVVITAAFGNKEQLPFFVRSMQRGYIRNVDRLLPQADASLTALLQSAPVREQDPILCIDGNLGNLLPAQWAEDEGKPKHLVSVYRSWIPLTPWALSLPLSDERKIVYLSRFSARTHLSGWLLYPRYHETDYPWLFKQLQQTHTATRTFATDRWQLTWFEWGRPDPGQLARFPNQ